MKRTVAHQRLMSAIYVMDLVKQAVLTLTQLSLYSEYTIKLYQQYRRYTSKEENGMWVMNFFFKTCPSSEALHQVSTTQG